MGSNKSKNMKVTLTLLALFSFAFAKPNLSDVPTIKVSQARSKGSVPEMQITFADGHEDKLILHRHFISGAERMMDKEMTCNYLGHLENDASACVAVTGCIGQDMELTINSKHNTKTNIYLLQKSGDVQLLPRPFSDSESVPEKAPEDIERAFTEVHSDEEIDPDDLADEMQWEAICTSADTSGCSSIPSYNELTMQIGYDDSFKNSFQSQGAANIYISQLLTHSQAYFCDKDSLGTKIQLKLDGIVHHPGTKTWMAEYNLQASTMYKIAEKIPASVDLTPFLSAPDTVGSYSGVGFVGTACKRGGGSRTSLTEKQGSIAITAGTFVHELGHNLGMTHDHKGAHKGRGCNGFMSYGDHEEKWSDCSRSDLLALYNQIKNDDEHGWTWCLSEPAQDVCPVAPPPPTITYLPDDCLLSKYMARRFMDGYCHAELNNEACGYDGGDCCLNKKGADTNKYCKNNCQCLGFDCPAYQQHPSWINDKFCDIKFNTPGCFYDSGDCCSKKVGNWNEYCGSKCTCLDEFHAMIIAQTTG